MTVSQASANDLEAQLSVPGNRNDLVTEGASSEFFPIIDSAPIHDARAKCGVLDGAKLVSFLGGFSRHKNVMPLLGNTGART